MKYLALITILISFSFFAQAADVDRVVVLKRQKTLLLVDSEGRTLKSYRVALGANPVGHKKQEGDERTPEGQYLIDRLNKRSKFYRSLHISYPNKADRTQAKKRGVSAGGDIMIHGLPNKLNNMWIPEWAYPVHHLYNWTDGCIAVTNKQMDEIIDLVHIDTPIFIFPY